jgi:hypothetical protein
VSVIFILGTAITTVADYAANLAVFVFKEAVVLQVDLFPFLQRRQFAPSAFAAGFFGYRLLYL